MRSTFGNDRSRSVAVWLFVVASLVLAMVVVGGATRLTGSGLSITQWKPVTGALPPLTDHAWAAEFARYRATPQYRLINRDMDLGHFQFIYWWEWGHRLLGRLVGAAFAVPFVAFLATRRLPRRLICRCAALLALGCLQGVVGWWMVRSGLEARVSVAPERLATHLSLALLLYCGLIWTGLEAWSGSGPGDRRGGAWASAGATLAIGVFFQCLLGALVAGNHAGLIDGDWPTMGGRVFPSDYWGRSLWDTLAHGVAATQFNHRLVAYGLVALALAMAVAGIRSRRAPAAIRGLAVAAGVVVSAQALLGIATLVAGDPASLAILHQAGALIALTLALVLAWRSRRGSTVL